MAEQTTKDVLEAIEKCVIAIERGVKALHGAIEADRQQLDVLHKTFEPELRDIKRRVEANEKKLDRLLERFGFLRSV